ncbi:MAG: hypothetical protein DSM106950_46135 [Stigonema ocellatum SAG 48.90 = DSM 106950]|nr:hypothetical protein [Stigonema ocellatum SAG 48.90 = DSM 106950]
MNENDAASPENSQIVEVVQQQIIDPTIEVGSGCEWRGSGAEPQWNNPKSMKAYDHIERHHGPKKKPNEFQGRASSTQDNQGQWFRVEYWVEAEKVTPKYPGRYIINFKRPIGRVYHPDGTTTEEVSRAVVVRNADGTLKSAYPVTNSTVLK